MEEKVLIKSKSVDTKKTLIRYFIVPVILLAIFVLYFALDINGCQHVSSYRPAYEWMPAKIDVYDVQFSTYLMCGFDFTPHITPIYMSIVLYLGVVTLILGVVFFLKYKSMSMTVTDKRIYGVSSFGKRVDFPISAINSVSASGKRDIHLLTPSGKVLFGNFENADELFHTISTMLVDRQR